MTAPNPKKYAREMLRYYFKLAIERETMNLSFDSEAEIESIVDNIVTAAVQEQQETIDQLDARIEDLEDRLNEVSNPPATQRPWIGTLKADASPDIEISAQPTMQAPPVPEIHKRIGRLQNITEDVLQYDCDDLPADFRQALEQLPAHIEAYWEQFEEE